MDKLRRPHLVASPITSPIHYLDASHSSNRILFACWAFQPNSHCCVYTIAGDSTHRLVCVPVISWYTLVESPSNLHHSVVRVLSCRTSSPIVPGRSPNPPIYPCGLSRSHTSATAVCSESRDRVCNQSINTVFMLPFSGQAHLDAQPIIISGSSQTTALGIS